MGKIYFWIKNARHIALPQSVMPAILAVSMSLQYEGFSWWMALIAVFGVITAHLGMNLVDDYFDYQVGSGEKRITMASEGMRARIAKYSYLTNGETDVKGLKYAICVFLLLAAIAGAVIICFRGLVPLYIAAIGAFLGITYSGWPLRLSYHGYGELVIGMMFGPLLMIGVQYASCGVFDEKIVIVSTAIGLLVTNIVYSHSVLDRHADSLMDKKTLAILLNKRTFILIASGIFNFVPFVLIIAGVLTGVLHWAYICTIILLPIAIYLWNSIRKFIDNLDFEIIIKPWMGPMGNFPAYREAGIDWFMLRWLLARNLISFFALILLIINVILKISSII